MTDELKPVRCGCGGRPEIEYSGDGICRVRCSFCLTGTVYHRNKAEAITAWSKAMGERTAKVEILEMRNTDNKVWKCSNCGQYMHRANWSREVKYCSHCGARLEWE